MFGYIKPYIDGLSQEEKDRYQSVYCGLCRTLNERYGTSARIGLTYDMTYLVLYLSSLYEPEEKKENFHCLFHPKNTDHLSVASNITEYAADLSVILVYYKCLDDWEDDHNFLKKCHSALLKKSFETACARWPRQTASIENGLKLLSEIEHDLKRNPEDAINCFGDLLGDLFVMKDDFWASGNRQFGRGLGRFIYLMDAVDDFEKDKKSGSYNPLILMNTPRDTWREHLMMLLNEASEIFEKMPLLQDENILRNTLYAGVWQKYNALQNKK